MRCAIAGCLFLFVAGPAPALAAHDACPDAPTEFAVVDDVSADLTITIADGRQITLAGIEPPRATAQQPARPAQVQARVRRDLAGTTIGLASLGARDRWGAVPAVVFTEAGTLGETLLAQGDVRVRPDPVSRPCRAALLAAEEASRDRGTGVWSDGALHALDATAVGDVATEGLTIVEGTVASVGETAARVYLNFGKTRGGFAISLAKRDIALMQSETVRKAREIGTRLRVRGLVDLGTGVRIDVSDADALEILPSETSRRPR